MNKDLIISKYKELVYAYKISDWVKIKQLEYEISLLQEQEEKEPTVTIPKWQMVHIEDTLRMANNIHHSQRKETCFDRCVCKAWKWACDALGKEYSFDTIPLDQSGIREELIKFTKWFNENMENSITDGTNEMVVNNYLKSNQ